MTLAIVSQGVKYRFVTPVSFFSHFGRVFFAHHLDEEDDRFFVSDLRTGLQIVGFVDTEQEAIKRIRLYLREENMKEKFAAYELNDGIFVQNIDDFDALDLVERDGYLGCRCAMECLDDAVICRHRPLFQQLLDAAAKGC